MRVAPRTLVPPLIAALTLFLMLRQTSQALERWGAWPLSSPTVTPAANPYARLDAAIARPQPPVDPGALRDPFGFGVVAGPPRHATRTEPRGPARPALPTPPVLTSITWTEDTDPRATFRYNGRDYSLGENGLFAEYRVRSITRTQVILERNGQPLVLTLRPKGD